MALAVAPPAASADSSLSRRARARPRRARMLPLVKFRRDRFEARRTARTEVLHHGPQVLGVPVRVACDGLASGAPPRPASLSAAAPFGLPSRTPRALGAASASLVRLEAAARSCEATSCYGGRAATLPSGACAPELLRALCGTDCFGPWQGRSRNRCRTGVGGATIVNARLRSRQRDVERERCSVTQSKSTRHPNSAICEGAVRWSFRSQRLDR